MVKIWEAQGKSTVVLPGQAAAGMDNTGVYEVTGPRLHSSSALKSACDPAIRPFQKSAKTPFFTRAKTNARTVTTPRQGTPRPSRHVTLVDILSNSVRSHAGLPPGLDVAVNTPAW